MKPYLSPGRRANRRVLLLAESLPRSDPHTHDWQGYSRLPIFRLLTANDEAEGPESTWRIVQSMYVTLSAFDPPACLRRFRGASGWSFAPSACRSVDSEAQFARPPNLPRAGNRSKACIDRPPTAHLASQSPFAWFVPSCPSQSMAAVIEDTHEPPPSSVGI